MEKNDNDRVALVGIIISSGDAVEKVNAVLHDFGEYILGRMGLPIRDRGINAISIAVDAPLDKINSLSGKLGAIQGVSAKTLFPVKP